MRTSIINCARCSQDHLDLEFKPFTQANPTYSHWALCPTNGEPILMRMIEDDEAPPVSDK